MSLQVKVGNFSTATATGNQATTGVGFRPKVVIFFSRLQSSTIDGTSPWDFRMGIGVGVSSSQRWHVFASDEDFASTTYSTRGLRTTRCLEWSDFTYTALGSADLVSLDADGFTLNYSIVEATAHFVSYIALGGDGVQAVKAGSFDLTTGTGTFGVSGVGFQPSLVLLATSITNTTEGIAHGGNLGLGLLTAVDQWAMAVAMQDAAAAANTARAQRTDRCLITTTASAALAVEVERSSLDGDGFTLNKIAGPSATTRIPYLCLQGPQVKLGAFNVTPGSTSTPFAVAVTGVGFTPKVELLGSVFGAASSTALTSSYLCLGVATGTVGQQQTVCAYSADAVDPSEANTNFDGNLLALQNQYNVGASLRPWLYGEWDSWQSDGFTNEFTNFLDTTTRQFVYLVLGDEVPPATPGTGQTFTRGGAVLARPVPIFYQPRTRPIGGEAPVVPPPPVSVSLDVSWFQRRTRSMPDLLVMAPIPTTPAAAPLPVAQTIQLDGPAVRHTSMPTGEL